MKTIVGLPWRLDWDVTGLADTVWASFNAISKLGVNVKIYCLGPPREQENLSISQIQVKAIHNNSVFSPLINSIAFSHEFAKQVVKEEYDILHCLNTTSLFLTDRRYLFQTKNPTYAFALDTVKDEYPNTLRYQRLLKYYASVAELGRIEYDNAEIILAPSEVVKKNIVDYYEVDEKKIRVIPNGISTEICNFERPPKRPDEMKVVLYPGTPQVMKGFHYLVEAMREVRKEFPKAILLVCGRIHPYEQDILKDLIDHKRKESGIILTGFLPKEKLFKYYHMADVCCIPLLFGTMSIAILEAVAHGLPVVTTVHSGLPEVQEVGMEVPAKDSEATANAITTLLSDPELWKKKSENSRNVIKSYLWSEIAKKFVEVYSGIRS